MYAPLVVQSGARGTLLGATVSQASAPMISADDAKRLGYRAPGVTAFPKELARASSFGRTMFSGHRSAARTFSVCHWSVLSPACRSGRGPLWEWHHGAGLFAAPATATRPSAKHLSAHETDDGIRPGPAGAGPRQRQRPDDGVVARLAGQLPEVCPARCARRGRLRWPAAGRLASAAQGRI